MQVNDMDVVTAVQHWPFENIKADWFSALFEGFISAFFTMLREIIDLAD